MWDTAIWISVTVLLVHAGLLTAEFVLLEDDHGE